MYIQCNRLVLPHKPSPDSTSTFSGPANSAPHLYSPSFCLQTGNLPIFLRVKRCPCRPSLHFHPKFFVKSSFTSTCQQLPLSIRHAFTSTIPAKMNRYGKYTRSVGSASPPMSHNRADYKLQEACRGAHCMLIGINTCACQRQEYPVRHMWRLRKGWVEAD